MKTNRLMISCLCLAVLFFPANLFAAPVPDTGQTKCYDVAGNVIACPSPGQPLYGQDANNTINPMSYTKLDGSGNALLDSAESWVMVRDNVTGLIWEVKNDKNGTTDYNNPHDADNYYTWYNPNDPYPGYRGSTDTQDFIDALNSDHFGGYSDWRLPSIKELDSIVNLDIPYPGPAINTAYFPNTVPAYYWSSTNLAAVPPHCAWGVAFDYGFDGYLYKFYGYHVRAVRGGQ